MILQLYLPMHQRAVKEEEFTRYKVKSRTSLVKCCDRQLPDEPQVETFSLVLLAGGK